MTDGLIKVILKTHMMCDLAVSVVPYIIFSGLIHIVTTEMENLPSW